MKAYHRIVGDPPSRGFGASIDSPGFPKDTWAATVTSVRLQTAVPGPKLPVENTVVEQYRAYELQSLGYGEMGAIGSAIGLKKELSARPHGYSHIVAFANDQAGHVATDDGDYAQWLSYDAFMPMSEFWSIPANLNTIEATDFTPPQAASFTWEGALPEGMQEALLVRYWRIATRRAFGAKQNATASEKVVIPVEVCLGEEKDCVEIIAQAKKFFGGVIASKLPQPVHNILSMSAPVSQKSAITPFQPTALIFLYPEEGLTASPMLFDLRTGAYAPLSPREKRFGQMILRKEQPAALTELYRRYLEKVPNQSPTHCTFMADFDVAWLLFELEEGQLSPQELFTLWRDLVEHLRRRHNMPDALRDYVLENIEERILERLVAQTVIAFALTWTAEELRFVFKRALTASDSLAMKEAALLAHHQKTRKPPFIANILNEIDFDNDAQVKRGSHIYGAVLEQAYIDPPLPQQERDLLASSAYVKLCRQYPALQDSTAQFVMNTLQQHPERNLFMMPLSTQFLDGYVLLRQSLRLLCQSYTKELPSRETCKDIQVSLKEYLDDDNRELLVQYYVQCFFEHIDSPKALEPVCKAIGYDTAEVLTAMLKACEGREGAVVFLSAEQLQELFLSLLPMASDKEKVREAFLSYIEKVLESSLQAQKNRFHWLCTINPQGDLLSVEGRRDLATQYYYRYGLQFAEVPTAEAFSTLFQWMKAGAPDGQYRQRHEEGLKKLYDRLGEAGLEQLSLLLPYFAFTGDAPYVNAVFLHQCQKDLEAAWKQGEKYWDAISKKQADWRKGNFGAEQMLDSQASGLELREVGQKALEKELSSLKTPEAFQSACRRRDEEGNNAFGVLWNQVMQRVFASQYEQLLAAQCNTLEDVDRLEKLAVQFGAADVLKDSYGQQCVNALKQTIHFIRQVLPSLDEGGTVEKTREMMAWLLALKRDGERGDTAQKAYQKMRHLLKETFFVTFRTQVQRYGVRKRIAVGLLCCMVSEDEFLAKAFVELFGSLKDADMQKPYDAENIALLAALSSLFGLLGLYHPNYPKVLHKALVSEPFLSYTRAVRKDRKNARKYFPWQTSGWKKSNQAFEPNSELRLWLTSK